MTSPLTPPLTSPLSSSSAGRGASPDALDYEPRPYAGIVRDLLTTLTAGTVREPVVTPVDGPIRLDQLAQRPIRRVSHLEGVTDVGGSPVAVQFTEADFDVVDSDADGLPDSVEFRKNGRKPIPGSTLTVNYYPVQLLRPVPLTDLNVGSVVRTLLETVAREVALEEQYLQRIYRSAFLETAEGNPLEKVVALIGVARLPAGHPLVTVRFSRNAATGGKITVPAGTVVTDAAAKPARYLTVTSLTLEAGEQTRAVLAAGASPDTPVVDADALSRLETAIAGVSTVSNPDPAYRQTAPEADAELRRRAVGALHGAIRGTVDALRFGVLSVPGVKGVEITERPDGQAGVVRLNVAYAQPGDPQAAAAVAERVEQLRPAGIRVDTGTAGHKAVAVTVFLVLAGTGVSGVALSRVTAGVEQRIADRLGAVPPGGQIRVTALTAAALEDPLVADATVAFTDPAAGPIDTLTLGSGEVLDVLRPFTFPPPQPEQGPGGVVPTLSDVDAVLPLRLQPGVTVAEAAEAIRLAVESLLPSRSPSVPLTVDGLAAAIRDDTRFGLVRELATVTVESGGRFVQLLDGQGSYLPAAGEQLRRRTLDVHEDPS